MYMFERAITALGQRCLRSPLNIFLEPSILKFLRFLMIILTAIEVKGVCLKGFIFVLLF